MADFDQSYFERAYRKGYERQNPLRKVRYYLDAIRQVRLGGRLLDIGCAFGSFLREAQHPYSVTGCDVSAYAVEQAKQAVPSGTIMQATIEQLEPGGRYDVITCFDVLEHVQDLDGAFRRIRTLLADQGLLALTVPVYDTVAGKAVMLLDRDETHIWKESRWFWRDKLEAHGFRIVDDRGLWRYACPGGCYLFWGGRRWRNFSPALLLLGERI